MKDRHRTLSEWVALIDGWRQSGLSQLEFCRRAGIKQSTLQSRLYKTHFKNAIEAYRCQSQGIPFKAAARPDGVSPKTVAWPSRRPSGSSAAFVPVRFSDPSTQPETLATLEILLASGQRIAVKPGFDPETLRRIVAALES